MRKAYDVIVIGLGAMGSAALYQLARQSVKVLGIDQFHPPHTLGSTHGDTRITRVAIGEGEEYVPLAKRSHEIWDELYRETGTQLLYRVGGLIMAVPEHGAMHGSGDFLGTTIGAAEKFAIPHEVLTTKEIGQRFPQFNLLGNERGYYEPGAGYVKPELCIKTQIEQARSMGAKVHFYEEVANIVPIHRSRNHMVVTSDGTFEAEQVIITAGSWVNQFLNERSASLFKVYRQVLYWFQTSAGGYSNYLPDKCPIFIWEPGGGREFIYGFPAIDGLDGGVKVATEQLVVETDPRTVDRTVQLSEIEAMYRSNVAERLLGLQPECVKAAVCLYTKTTDSRFVIDSHPELPNVLVASPCSGHGFKHSAAIGESLAQWATTGTSTIDLSPFSFSRFSPP